MSADPFNDPGTASGARITDYEGRLLLITPTGYREEIETMHGTKDAVEANVVVIDEDAPTSSEKHEGLLLFQGRLIGQTKGFVGKGLVLGRLGKGTAEKGKNAPWELATATDEEKDKARAYLTSVSPEL